MNQVFVQPGAKVITTALMLQTRCDAGRHGKVQLLQVDSTAGQHAIAHCSKRFYVPATTRECRINSAGHVAFNSLYLR